MGNELAIVMAALIDTSEPAAVRQIVSRDDLSFTYRDSEGRLENWVNGRHKFHSEAWMVGQARCAEVVTLAAASEYDAYNAFRFALGSKNWSSFGHGEEDGFAEELAKLALAGLRAIRRGASPFDPKAASEEADRAEMARKRKASRLRQLAVVREASHV